MATLCWIHVRQGLRVYSEPEDESGDEWEELKDAPIVTPQSYRPQQETLKHETWCRELLSISTHTPINTPYQKGRAIEWCDYENLN